jgi:hypothetical protein
MSPDDFWLEDAQDGRSEADAYDLLSLMEGSELALAGASPSTRGGSAYDEALDDA